MQDYKLFFFTRKKKEKSVLTTHYNKFLNLLMRKGLKNMQIKFFLTMLRNHKKKINLICLNNFNTSNFSEIVNRPLFPTFSKLLKVVFRLITLKLELRHSNFRRKNILIPSPVSPWRGLRLGLNLLLKNSANNILYEKVLIKNKKCNLILHEFWKTFRNVSTTCNSIEEFTLKVLEHSENFRLTQLFPLAKVRRSILPELKLQEKKVSRASSRQKFLLFLGERNLKTRYRSVFYMKNNLSKSVLKKSNISIYLNRFNRYSRFFLKKKFSRYYVKFKGSFKEKRVRSIKSKVRFRRRLGRWRRWKYITKFGRLYHDNYLLKKKRNFRFIKNKIKIKGNRFIQTNSLKPRVKFSS